MSPRAASLILPLFAALALTACGSNNQAETSSPSPEPTSSPTSAVSTQPSTGETTATATSTPPESTEASPSNPATETSASTGATTIIEPSEQPSAPEETPVQAINPPVNDGAPALVTDLAPYQVGRDRTTPLQDGKLYFQTADGAGCVMEPEAVSCYRIGSQGRHGYGVMWLNPGSVPYQDFLDFIQPGFPAFAYGSILPAGQTLTLGEFTCTATPEGAARCDNGTHWFALSNNIKDFSS
ncbi:hypothetical protein [Rothia nasisuis]|uniref:hypothetical protein n=1 Tax=Rothia nasisuis TaxID=2109647 RepID=UPI001F48458B|nr:hypothetical protein [Rothia nasisuis]